MSWTRKDVLHFLGLMAACAAVAALLVAAQTCARRKGGGTAAGTILDGRTVIVLDHLGHEERETRVTTIDAVTGAHSIRYERGHLDRIGGRIATAGCDTRPLPVSAEAGAATPMRDPRALEDSVTYDDIPSLVLHEPGRLSRVDATGAAVWTIALGKSCEEVTVVDGVLVLTTVSSTYRARGIDLATGEIRWRVGF